MDSLGPLDPQSILCDYRIISALPFIPEDKILSTWEQLRPLLPDFSSFATYFEYTWVGSRSYTPSSQFHHGINMMPPSCDCLDPPILQRMASRVQQDLTGIPVSVLSSTGSGPVPLNLAGTRPVPRFFSERVFKVGKRTVTVSGKSLYEIV